MQSKLARWSSENKGPKFDRLLRLLADATWLAEAARITLASRGARTAGVDGIDKQRLDATLPEELSRIRAELLAGTDEPLPARRVYIPKASDKKKLRPLGIPSLRDRIVERAMLMAMEPIWESDFQRASFGFRPARSVHHAVRMLKLQQLQDGGEDSTAGRWVVEGDLASYLDRGSHYTSVCCWGVEEIGKCCRYLYSNAFGAPTTDVNGFEFAALYTLQDSLPRDAEQVHGLEHFHVTLRRIVDEERTHLLGHPDAPRCTGRDLFAGDEAIVEPAMQRGRCDTEDLCRTVDRHALCIRGFRGRLEARYFPVRTQTADAIGSERQPSRRRTALTVENAGDERIRVMRGQATQQFDGVLRGTDRRWMRARQRHIDLAHQPAAPAQRQMCIGLLALDTQDYFLEQRAQQLLAITVGRRCGGPDGIEILTEREDGASLLGRERARSRALALLKFCFGGLQFPQGIFPLRFKSARNEAIVRIDRAITPLSTLRTVTRTLNIAPELREGRLVIRLEFLRGLECGFESRRRERRKERGRDGRIDLAAADVQTILPATVDDVLAGAVISGRGELPAVMHGEPSPTVPADGDSLQQRGPFSHSASAAAMGPGAGILRKAALIGFEGFPVDVAAMMVADEDRPLLSRALLDTLAQPTILIDVTDLLCSAIHVHTGVERVCEDLGDFSVRGYYPARPVESVRLQREAQALGAEPQPYAACRAHLRKALENGVNRSGDRLIGIQQHFTVCFAAHQADGQPPMQLTAGRFVADAAEQSGTQDMQFRFGHRAFSPSTSRSLNKPG